MMIEEDNLPGFYHRSVQAPIGLGRPLSVGIARWGGQARTSRLKAGIGGNDQEGEGGGGIFGDASGALTR